MSTNRVSVPGALQWYVAQHRWPDEAMFHYTSRQAFENIVAKRQMWATDLRMMNDPDELRYGRALIEERMRRAAQRTYTNYVTVDRANGELLAQGDSGLGIVVFNLTDSGNVAPKRNLTGGATGITSVGGLIVDDANNRLIADDQNANSVLAFSRTANGNTAPLLMVSGPATGLSTPFGLALDAVGGLTGVGGVGSAVPALSWVGLLALSIDDGADRHGGPASAAVKNADR